MLSLCGFFFSESQSLILLKNRRNTTGHLTFVLCFGQKSRVYSNVLEEYQAGRRHNIPSADLDSGDVRAKVGVGERKRAEGRVSKVHSHQLSGKRLLSMFQKSARRIASNVFLVGALGVSI